MATWVILYRKPDEPKLHIGKVPYPSYDAAQAGVSQWSRENPDKIGTYEFTFDTIEALRDFPRPDRVDYDGMKYHTGD
jgi:hypothetical protein